MPMLVSIFYILNIVIIQNCGDKRGSLETVAYIDSIDDNTNTTPSMAPGTHSSLLRGNGLVLDRLDRSIRHSMNAQHVIHTTYLLIPGCTALIRTSASAWFANLRTCPSKYWKSSSSNIAGTFAPFSDSLSACRSCISTK